MKEPTRDERIIGLYKAHYPASKIAKEFGISERQVQRIIYKAGVSRTRSESYKLAIEQGRMRYYRKPEHLKAKRKTLSPKLRALIFKRDNCRCVMCGATPKDNVRLEIDHINSDATDNSEDNLQVLCDVCNKGKAAIDGRYSYEDRVSKA